jgi:hypothetical protein
VEFVLGRGHSDSKDDNDDDEDSEESRSVKKTLYSGGYTETYEHGDRCDVTGERRGVEVVFECNALGQRRLGARAPLAVISTVSELRTCFYRMVVQTPLVCEHKAYRGVVEKAKAEADAAPKIVCLTDKPDCLGDSDDGDEQCTLTPGEALAAGTIDEKEEEAEVPYFATTTEKSKPKPKATDGDDDGEGVDVQATVTLAAQKIIELLKSSKLLTPAQKEALLKFETEDDDDEEEGKRKPVLTTWQLNPETGVITLVGDADEDDQTQHNQEQEDEQKRKPH